MNFKKQLREGLLTNNPVVGQLLGMCSTMAITTTLFNGLGMGLSVTLILICSNVVISLLRKVIPDKIRIAAYIVVIAGFVTIIDLLLQAYLPALSKSLGVFIPLIVVNCIILGRAEAFASKNGVLASAVDGLTQGIGYTVALVCMCVIRELLGSGTDYLDATVIAWTVAVIFAFVTNKLIVFESKSWKPAVAGKEFVGFIGARLFSLLVELVFMFVMVTLLKWNDFVAKFIVQVIVVILNYVFSKLLIFKNK